MNAHIFRAKRPGPVLLVSAGLHGDEVNGIEIIRRFIKDGLFKNLSIGTVIAIPLINIYGFINFSRTVPDGKDINRSFPGSSKGSLASQVAYVLSNQIVPLIDVGIDFHTGGASRYNYPQIRYSKNDPNAEALAKVFAAPFLISSKPIEKSFRKTALYQGKTVLVFEGAEALRYDELSIKEAILGTKRVLNKLGMRKDPLQIPESKEFHKTIWQRADVSGLYIWEIASGNYVEKGALLGNIHDINGTFTRAVKAKISGYIIGHNNAAVVNAGDALFHIAQ